MGVTGSWAARRDAQSYTGATRWGNGYNPIHEVRDQGRGRVIGVRANLLPLGEPSDAVDDQLTSREIDWVCEDYVDMPMDGERYRYQDDRPRWDQTTPQFRDRTTSPAMGEQPAWGVYYDYNPDNDWPRPGPTGGTAEWLDVSHGENIERQRAIAVPTQPVSGGWLSKVRSTLADTTTAQDPSQDNYTFTVNNATYQGQGVREMDNERARARGTDAPRSPIRSRAAAMVEKKYGQSFGMGGGAGSPDMLPREINDGLRRPFYYRTAAIPPMEKHTWNEIEYRDPIQRDVPPDPYQGDPEVNYDESDDAQDWGY